MTLGNKSFTLRISLLLCFIAGYETVPLFDDEKWQAVTEIAYKWETKNSIQSNESEICDDCTDVHHNHDHAGHLHAPNHHQHDHQHDPTHQHHFHQHDHSHHFHQNQSDICEDCTDFNFNIHDGNRGYVHDPSHRHFQHQSRATIPIANPRSQLGQQFRQSQRQGTWQRSWQSGSTSGSTGGTLDGPTDLLTGALDIPPMTTPRTFKPLRVQNIYPFESQFVESNDCMLPPIPDQGRYNKVEARASSDAKKISPKSKIVFSCKKNHKLSQNAREFECFGSNIWIPNNIFPKCIKISGDNNLNSRRLVSFKPKTTVRPVSETTNTNLRMPEKNKSATTGCTLPRKPSNGKYEVPGSQQDLTPGKKVAQFSQITFKCENKHILKPNTPQYYCSPNNTWIPSNKFPACVPTCPPLVSKSLEIKCKLGKTPVDCNKPVLSGTVADFKCKPLYENLSSLPNKCAKCVKGEWDHPLSAYECHPTCGRKISKGAKAYIIGGQKAVKGSYPWQIAVYRKLDKLLICGGSIIRLNIVISAAHCFTASSTGNPESKENYLLVAGKYYNSFNDSRDATEKQVRNIKSLNIPEDYKSSSRNMDSDIAVIVVDKPYELTVSVQPVCFEWLNDVDRSDLQNQLGIVTGWGNTEAGTDNAAAMELKQLEVPYIDFAVCFQAVPEDFQRYITKDKICAGYRNGSSACTGDSGGPLVFKMGHKYYLRGIVSNGPRDGGYCDSKHYTLYTDVSVYRNYISSIEELSRD